MPYTVKDDGEKGFCIYKQDADEQPSGEAVACHPTMEEAQAQIAALMADEEAPSEASEDTADTGGGGGSRAGYPSVRYLRAFAQRGKRSEPGTPIRFVASTEGVKRDGMDLPLTGWRLENYNANPVVLWSHDSASPPIGRGVISADTEKRELLADVTFDQGDPIAVNLERKVRDGYLNAVSVSWADVSKTERDLLEVSLCSVPADPQALASRAALLRQMEVAMADGDRVGKVLSQRNLDDLQSAVDLIRGVIKRAKEIKAEDDDEARAHAERAILDELERILK